MRDDEVVRAGLGPWTDEWVEEHAEPGNHADEVREQRAAFDRILADLLATRAQLRKTEEQLQEAERNIKARQKHHATEDLPEIESLRTQLQEARRHGNEDREAWFAKCASLRTQLQEAQARADSLQRLAHLRHDRMKKYQRRIQNDYESLRARDEALLRCCEVIENDVALLRKEGFEGASWQLDAIRKARRALSQPTTQAEGAHDHREFVPGCYRCDLSRHEATTQAEDA